ncbi:hypothetical protein Fleli_3082 [Bernardetia litoralis DSM 6794]|uniref:Uncharacterized protein n=1 Tax=Bernardetia litoralis (strain ATCC 23117 / DSM 6794 / NBRC 15988 / NCIMB 1366 / Fx l1 / Sio-4) TaxID=880071 RepID=I4AN87_BERLS|nr:hypothetical protein [Bernardetia litoralis]AFM05422.1 hypothetical protein Fleli_3082 [Bernardetia litoralis DSM 6794]
MTKEEYETLNQEEKVKYWSGTLHQEMRWNVESGINAYDVFSKEWLEEVKPIEPNIEEILKEVIEKHWKNYWNKQKIWEALKT